MYCMYICTTVFVCTLINNRVLLHKTMIKIIFYSGHVGKRPPPPINYQHIIDGRNSQNNKYQTPRHLIDTTSATFLVLYTHTSNLHTPDPCVWALYHYHWHCGYACSYILDPPGSELRLFITDFWPGNFVKTLRNLLHGGSSKKCSFSPHQTMLRGRELAREMYTQIVSAESPLFFFFLTCPLC